MPATKNRKSERAKEIGARIANARKFRELSQREFGRIIGVHQVQVSKYERGIDIPDVIMIERIAILVGVNPSKICGWDNE